jgi:protein SCO1/2
MPRIALVLMLGLALAGAVGAAVPLPGASLYQLAVPLETSAGTTLRMADLRGQPVVVTLFYAQCRSVCPLIALALQRLDAAVPAPDRERLRILMVSLDPAHDTPEAMAHFAAEHGIEPGRWILARPRASDVRPLAAALGIRYRTLPDGSFSHSTVLTLLDVDGVPRARTTAITRPDPAFEAAVRAAAK